MTGPPVIVRLKPSDLAEVRELLAKSGLEVDLEAELGRAISLPWVLKDNENAPPIAFLLAWSVADELHLLDVACHPDHRRQGHAKALLGALLEFAREEHKRLVLLEVRHSNRAAIALYTSLGFETIGVRRGYYADNEDAAEMQIRFDPKTGDIVRGES